MNSGRASAIVQAFGGKPGMISRPPRGGSCANGATTPSYRNIKVGGLSPEVDDVDLRGLFDGYGKIESAKVMLDVSSCRSRGYGFVLFDTEEAGCRAFGERNKQSVVVKGKSFVLDIKPSDWDARAATEGPAIFVRNIPRHITDAEVRSVFAQYGDIVQFSSRAQRLSHDPDGAPQGAPLPDRQAMIEFNCEESARRAVDATHRVNVFQGATTPILSKFADNKGKKQHRRQAPTAFSAPSVTTVSVGIPQVATVQTPATAASQVRYPDARPLPLAPRPGHQRIFFQGVLGITPDGILYPIQPEMCHYLPQQVTSHSVPQMATSSGVSVTPPHWCSPVMLVTPASMSWENQFALLHAQSPSDHLET